jgi:hypothetical protein
MTPRTGQANGSTYITTTVSLYLMQSKNTKHITFFADVEDKKI